jgi:hypothetical protein
LVDILIVTGSIAMRERTTNDVWFLIFSVAAYWIAGYRWGTKEEKREFLILFFCEGTISQIFSTIKGTGVGCTKINWSFFALLLLQRRWLHVLWKPGAEAGERIFARAPFCRDWRQGCQRSSLDWRTTR